MAETSKLLSILQLSSEVADNVESLLNSFQALDASEKVNAKLEIAGKIFPIVFGEDVSLQSDANFSTRKETAWSTGCWLNPGVIVLPRTAQDVGKALAISRFFNLKFSIRGGGHLHNPGFTSNDGGVVIHMKHFDNVKLSEDRSTVAFGAGLRWIQVYEALDQYGLAVTGGRVPSVGVAGLLLGGGLSFQNSEYGLSCNGVVEYEVVLADSSVVKVSATQNADLFWALKGGGPNFGIVTKFTMATVSNKIWAEGRVVAVSENEKVHEALIKYHEAAEKDQKATVICNQTKDVTLLVLVYNEPVNERPAVFEAFDKLDALTYLVPTKIYTIFEMLQGVESVNATEQKNHDMRTMTSLPDIELYKAAEKLRVEQTEAIKDIPGATLMMTIQPISSTAVTAAEATGGSPLGLKAQAHQWFLMSADWSNAEDEEKVLAASRKIVDGVTAIAKKNGTFVDFQYSNYSSRDQNPIATYGAENLERLKSIAKSYDPEGIFQTLQNGGWLVTKVA